MRRSTVLTALVSAVALFATASRVTFPKAVSTIPPRSFEFTSIVHVAAMPPGSRELRLWIPLPYQGTAAFQSISGLRIEGPVPYRIGREPGYGNRYAYLAVKASQDRRPFDIRLSFHARRFEHRVSLRQPAGPPSMSAEARLQTARYLRPDRLVPIDGEIGELSAEQTQGVTQPIAKARRIYDYVIASMHYDHNGTGWGHGDAIWACTAKHGNCTDFHSLFIGMARAAGIPARFEIGLQLPADSHAGPITIYHCWAEFYTSGIGWVPIDASEAWKHKQKINYFFGAIGVNRLMFSLGRDITLVPAQKGPPLNYFVYPYAELDGAPFSGVTYDDSFRDDAAPAHAAPTAQGN